MGKLRRLTLVQLSLAVKVIQLRSIVFLLYAVSLSWKKYAFPKVDFGCWPDLPQIPEWSSSQESHVEWLAWHKLFHQLSLYILFPKCKYFKNCCLMTSKIFPARKPFQIVSMTWTVPSNLHLHCFSKVWTFPELLSDDVKKHLQPRPPPHISIFRLHHLTANGKIYHDSYSKAAILNSPLSFRLLLMQTILPLPIYTPGQN